MVGSKRRDAAISGCKRHRFQKQQAAAMIPDKSMEPQHTIISVSLPKRRHYRIEAPCPVSVGLLIPGFSFPQVLVQLIAAAGKVGDRTFNLACRRAFDVSGFGVVRG